MTHACSSEVVVSFERGWGGCVRIPSSVSVSHYTLRSATKKEDMIGFARLAPPNAKTTVKAPTSRQPIVRGRVWVTNCVADRSCSRDTNLHVENQVLENTTSMLWETHCVCSAISLRSLVHLRLVCVNCTFSLTINFSQTTLPQVS